MDATQTTPWLTVTEAARRARVNREWIERMLATKRLPSYTPRRQRLINAGELDALIREFKAS